MATSGPRTLNGKVVLTVYLLDNSYKTILCEPTSTVHVSSAVCIERESMDSLRKRLGVLRGHSTSNRTLEAWNAMQRPR